MKQACLPGCINESIAPGMVGGTAGEQRRSSTWWEACALAAARRAGGGEGGGSQWGSGADTGGAGLEPGAECREGVSAHRGGRCW